MAKMNCLPSSSCNKTITAIRRRTRDDEYLMLAELIKQYDQKTLHCEFDVQYPYKRIRLKRFNTVKSALIIR